jgi:CheY-like chemotaxis protein
MSDPNSSAAAQAPVSLFYSYAHEDEALRDELQRHLKILQLRGLIAPWHDRAIVAGAAWDTEIHRELQAAELVLLLLSVDFLASDYILGVELKTALARAQAGSATVVPILLRPLDLDALDGGPLPMAQLLQRQGLPRDLKAVNTWRPRDAGWVNVSKGLRATVADIQARRGVTATRSAVPPSGPADALDPLPMLREMAPPAVPPMAPWPAVAAPSPQAQQQRRDAFRTTAFAPPLPPQVAGPGADPLLDAVLASASAGILAAQRARSSTLPAPAALHDQAMALLGASHLPRLLWVDDMPEGNGHEAEMLARLQIELVQVRSTDEALALLRHDQEGFDLVVSDWTRSAEPPDAGLRLQRAMQQRGLTQPVVIYHGEFNPGRRQQRAEQARQAGVFGEAVLPMELLGLVQAALARSAGASR